MKHPPAFRRARARGSVAELSVVGSVVVALGLAVLAAAVVPGCEIACQAVDMAMRVAMVVGPLFLLLFAMRLSCVRGAPRLVTPFDIDHRTIQLGATSACV